MKKIFSLALAMLLLVSALPLSVSAATQTPVIVDTVYPTEDVVVADIVLTQSPYNADSSGVADCTEVLQRAVNDCAASGGGTVFLPVGSYRLTRSIYIHPFVTVRGDWADPDVFNETGTLIIADVESIDAYNPALFTVGGSAGAKGLAVWYPNQSIENVKPYPFTFYVNGAGSSYMLQTIADCTLFNSYRGIGACAEVVNDIYQCHEMLTVENVKGTCLDVGIASYNSADVDTYESVYFSGKYWAKAGRGFNTSPPSLEDINAYTRRNTRGLLLADLEWPEFADIHVSDCLYGILFTNGPRISFSGTFYDLFITDCDYGFYVPKGTSMARDKSWGIAVARGVIEGSEFAIYDPGENRGIYNDLEIRGKVKGKNISVSCDNLSDFDLDYTLSYQKPVSVLYTVTADKTGRTDVSAAINAKLREAAATGGVVYLPPGLYRLDAPLSVPAGVELRGASSVATREQSGSSAGTLLLAYYGYDDADALPLITLAGDGAGLNAIRVNYVFNNPVIFNASGDYRSTSAAVCGKADNVYVVNSCINLASVGIEMSGCENFFIKKVVGCCLESMFDIRCCEGGMITGCLQNGNNIPRNGFAATGIAELGGWLTEDRLFELLFIPILREKCEYIRLTCSTDITVYNTFMYGGASFLVSDNSEALVANVGNDGSGKDDAMLITRGGRMTMLNSMRSTFDGHDSFKSFDTDGVTVLRIYNRLAVDLMYYEFTHFENTPENTWLFNLRQRLIDIYTAIGIRASLIEQE